MNLSAVIVAHTGIILGVYHVHEEKKKHSAYSMFHEIVWTDPL